MHFRLPALFLFLSLICSSCSFLFSTAYGTKNTKQLSQTRIADYAKRYKIPKENSFELDPAYFYKFLKSFDAKQYGAQVKNHYQPLQALYFDKAGNLQVFYINCYAGGFPNLEWNRDGNFNSFPPRLQAPVDSLVNYQTLSRYLKPLSKSKFNTDTTQDYTVVVFWNRMMGRQSERFIQTVQENCAKAQNQRINILYVNTDNMLANF